MIQGAESEAEAQRVSKGSHSTLSRRARCRVGPLCTTAVLTHQHNKQQGCSCRAIPTTPKICLSVASALVAS